MSAPKIEVPVAKKKRERRIPEVLTLRGRSAQPGPWLCLALCLRHPFEEDLAILDCWNPAHSLRITYVTD